ncbi:hypothetical protein CSAL01_10538 [Colletotrichum salicis]|uniref:Uncharacterized protein n=1 Tax=Colletotrichum salicis TaxID=1209931 RepID=A0A135SXH8_9PEZI|nr:hypothetical protein CSAL01_10538 [Colletotrichum salicis]
MVSLSLVTLLMASAVSAAPFFSVPLHERGINLTKWTPDHRVTDSEIVLLTNGEEKIIKTEDWYKLLDDEGILSEAPEIDHDWIESAANMSALEYDPSVHEKRDCAYTTSTIIDKTERFVDWDVQMSPVVIGPRGGMDLTVSKSYSVANSVSLSAGLSLTGTKNMIADAISRGSGAAAPSIGISLTRTWTTLSGNLIRGNVGEGYTGVVITTPWTTRRYGRFFQGCIGSLRQTGTWMADTHDEGSYEGVSWVSGAITVCSKKQSWIPLTRCHGKGEFR